MAACSRRKQNAKEIPTDKRDYQKSNQIKPHFMTFTVVDGGAPTQFCEYANHP